MTLDLGRTGLRVKTIVFFLFITSTTLTATVSLFAIAGTVHGHGTQFLKSESDGCGGRTVDSLVKLKNIKKIKPMMIMMVVVKWIMMMKREKKKAKDTNWLRLNRGTRTSGNGQTIRRQCLGGNELCTWHCSL